MGKYLKLIMVFVLFISFYNTKTSAVDVDLIVSPIKYELQLNPGATTTRTAKLINKSSNPMILHTGVSDFMSNDTTGNPVFVRKSELVNPDQELASWISISTNTISLAALEEKDIEFTINVPVDATPGGHYGAVFFKNYGEDNVNAGGQVKINVDYGVLLLITVDGDVIDNGNPGEPNINPGSSSGGSTSYAGGGIKIDSCPLGDFTKSNIDGKCIDDFGLGNIIDNLVGTGSTNDNNDNEGNSGEGNSGEGNSGEGNNNGSGSTDLDFNIEFEIPFNNEGNTHIKPDGKITLVDENGEIIKGVGKELIKNEVGTTIGEKIVDYIPINDNGGNVLPNTTRIFKSEWKGFPYEDYDEAGKKIIKYWTPSEYYTKKNIESKTFLFPWQRVNEKLEQKKVNAIIELAYKNYKGEEIEFNSAKDFYVDYKTEYVGYNPYFFLGLILSLGLLWFILFIIKKKRKKKCDNCGKYIKKDMKICPYCGEKQKEKKK
ncbi:DUF916 domain-containing protein [Candidatus Gracilibacteria bacterium]|nr:DUF916 domain-containing protein [Candidatus Gracilibacteria bacterium]